MSLSKAKVADVLKSLMARDNEELSLLRELIQYALQHNGGTPPDMGVGGSLMGLRHTSPLLELGSAEFFETIPAESQKYFHGLVEALEIYHSIYGRGLAPQMLTVGDTSFRVLKKIRDMCLEEGLRSIY